MRGRRQRFGRPGLHFPARHRRTRRDPRAHPQHERRDARLRRCQRQPAAGGQIEHARIAPGRDHHGADSATAGGLSRRAQNAGGVVGPHENDAARIKAKLGKSPRVGLSQLRIEDILADPDDGLFARGPASQAERKACRRCGIGRPRRDDFVQRAPREPAMERLIHHARPKRNRLKCARRGLPAQ